MTNTKKVLSLIVQVDRVPPHQQSHQQLIESKTQFQLVAVLEGIQYQRRVKTPQNVLQARKLLPKLHKAIILVCLEDTSAQLIARRTDNRLIISNVAVALTIKTLRHKRQQLEETNSSIKAWIRLNK